MTHLQKWADGQKATWCCSPNPLIKMETPDVKSTLKSVDFCKVLKVFLPPDG